MMLDLTLENGKKIYIESSTIESIEENTRDLSTITTKSGKTIRITEYCTDVYYDIKFNEVTNIDN